MYICNHVSHASIIYLTVLTILYKLVLTIVLVNLYLSNYNIFY